MKTQTELNADTLFAFQMALKGHKQFEFLTSGVWGRTPVVDSRFSCRIYHDLPSQEWTRHDGEDWKGDKDAKFEGVMFCNGRIKYGTTDLDYWTFGKSNFSGNPDGRIYAYKLAKQPPAIPEGFTKWDGGECPVAPETMVEAIIKAGTKATIPAGDWNWGRNNSNGNIIAYRVIEKKVVPWMFESAPLRPVRVKHKSSGALFATGMLPDCVTLRPDRFTHNAVNITYETLAADYLQLNGEVCGTEV
jgi:hypothetical protein